MGVIRLSIEIDDEMIRHHSKALILTPTHHNVVGKYLSTRLNYETMESHFLWNYRITKPKEAPRNCKTKGKLIPEAG